MALSLFLPFSQLGSLYRVLNNRVQSLLFF